MIWRARPEPPLEVLEKLRQPALADARPGAEKRRAATVGLIEKTLRAEGQRRKRWRSSWAGAGAAAALVAAGSVAFVRLHGVHETSNVQGTAKPAIAAIDPVELRVESGVAVTTRRGVAAVISAGANVQIAEGDFVRTGPDGHATLLLPRGVRVELSRATKAGVVSALESDQKLSLDIGETQISVPKPGGPSTFSVTTPDARVVVHGTEFMVRVEEGDQAHPTRTSVSVTRGAVSVVNATGERLLRPGESWSAASPEATAPTRAEPAAPSRARVANARESASSLAEQNRLFQAALDARRAGDDAAVLRAVDELFARYPETTLAQEARLARFRALKALKRNHEASREARRYLSAHPDTPAADEARRALLESTTSGE
jgi:hypothetical protein